MNDGRLDLTVGLCGLGNMGGAIAERLALVCDPILYDIDPAKPGERLEDLAESDVLLLCLPSPAASSSVVEKLGPLMRPGTVIVETSTVGSDHVEAMAVTAARHGVGFVDAAIAAGVGQMREGVAALLVGGDDATVTAVRPVLDAIARNVTRVGSLGSGAALKVINNAVAHAVMVVLVEAAALAEASGIDRSHLIALMTGDDAGLTRPLEHRLMERVAQGNYAGGMPTEAACKDSALVLGLAQQTHVPLFAIGGSHAVYEMATAQGYARDDYAAIAKLWEGWLGRTLSTSSEGGS